MFQSVMHPYLERCLSSIEGGTGGLSEVQGRARPAEGWSIAQVVDHLDRSYSGTAKGLERCLAANAPRATRATLSQRFWTTVVVGVGYFPAGQPSPPAVIPSADIGLAEALDNVRRSLRALDLAAMGASGRFGRAKVMDHPILGPFSVDQWRRFHWIHTRHHRRQIERQRRQV